MNGLVYLLFFSIFILDYLFFKLGVAPRIVTWSPEILSGVALFVVAARIARHYPIAVHPKYIFLFSVLLLLLAVGVVVNDVPSGAVFAGMRTYLRYAPFFLLPIVYRFSAKEIDNQLKLLMVFCVFQGPMAVFQRFFQYSPHASADVVTGTLDSSADLSIVLICGIALLVAFHRKGLLSQRYLLGVGILYFIPTVIDETAVSLFLLPLAIGVPLFLWHMRERSIGEALWAFGVLAGVVIVFAVAYNALYGARWQGGIQNLLTEDKAAEYVYKGATNESRADEGREHSEIGRIDSFVLPIKLMAKDPLSLLVGRGIGNVSDTFSRYFLGDFTVVGLQHGATMTTLSYQLWEIGLLGSVLSLTFFYFVFKDALFLSWECDASGAIALGWVGVTIILIICLAYKNLVTSTTVGYLMWYWSGYIASESRWRKLAARERA